MQRNSVSFYWLSGLHSNISLLVGWSLFTKIVYPLLYVKPGTVEQIALSLPLYALNVLAFGTLVYVATRPLLYLVDEMATGFGELMEQFFCRRR
jgi:hypothetical protein